MANQKIKEQIPTEQKIKESARRLFTERGYDSVTTRDIAADAQINPALVSYYFRGKEKLYQVIIQENFRQFVAQIIPVLGDESKPVEEIIEKIAASYIDMLRVNPDLPFFILNSFRNNISFMETAVGVSDDMKALRNAFIKRMNDHVTNNLAMPVATPHFMMNFMSMVIFPFLAKSMVIRTNKITEQDFDDLMEERKRLIPLWMKTIFKTK